MIAVSIAWSEHIEWIVLTATLTFAGIIYGLWWITYPYTAPIVRRWRIRRARARRERALVRRMGQHDG